MTDRVADKAEKQQGSDPAHLNERIKQMKQTFYEARAVAIPLVYALVNLASQI